MATSGQNREGLGERVGRVPASLRRAVMGMRTVWVHAVSVGEVLAAERMIHDLQQALPGWVVAVSTTTSTGQKIARERLPGCPVFYFPLDFGFAMRRYLRVLQPSLVVLVESELWPRMLAECERSGVPVAVVNARVSDRSFRRTMPVRGLWQAMARRVTLFLAQGEETAARLRQLGVAAERIRTTGNLKYDTCEPAPTQRTADILALTGMRRLIVAASTLPGEEAMLLAAWDEVRRTDAETCLMLAPRHPVRFNEIEAMLKQRAQTTSMAVVSEAGFAVNKFETGGVILLDTLGDLASVLALASVAFIGGSLVPKGGHNPLEAARFGVPVVMGESFENFREIVTGMQAAQAIRIVAPDALGRAFEALLADDGGMGERGRHFFAAQAGAVGRTVAALLELIAEREA